MSDEDKARDIYLTAFTDLNAAVFNAQEMVWEAERRVERELLRRIANGEQAFVCERCGTTVWVEIAEGELPILVENAGTPHEDNCRPQGQLFEPPPQLPN